MKKPKSGQKTFMKVISLVLVVVIVVGIFVTVQKRKKAKDIELDEVPVITFFGITGETTTPEDIIAVERDLNNVLLRTTISKTCGAYAVKLFLAPKDRYGAMIESAKEMMNAFKENEKENKGKKGKEKSGFEYSFDYATSTFSYNCDKNAVSPSVVYNQDTIIEMLDDGKDIFPNTPSIDVMLVTDYDDYYEMAHNSELRRLNEYLAPTGTAKSLRQSIPQPFFDAVTLSPASTKDIYGIPCVHQVGVYEFMVYDKDLLDKYGVSEKQLLRLEDLNSYLKSVHEDVETDVIPLLNSPRTVRSMELSDDKLFTAVQKSGESFASLEFPYDNDDFVSCYALVSCYRSLGYMSKKGADVMARTEGDIEKDDFAVAFFRGTEQEVKQLSEKTGKNLVYNVYSNPYATTDEIGESMFCVCSEKYSVPQSKVNYVADENAESKPAKDDKNAKDDKGKKPKQGKTIGNPDQSVDFICKLNAPKSRTDIKNILLYGASGINYAISDTDGYVAYANGNTYNMDNLYTGHTLHAFPAHDKGIDPEWVERVQTHNRDLVSTEFSDFKFQNKVISKEDTEGKLGNKGETVKIELPDYFSIVKREMASFDSAGDYYTTFVNGYRCNVEINNEFQSELYNNIRKKIDAAVRQDYDTAQKKEASAKFDAEIRADETTMEILRTGAKNSTAEELHKSIREQLENQKRNEYKNLGTEMTEEEILEQLKKDVPDTLVQKIFDDTYPDGEKDANLLKEIEKTLEQKIADKVAKEVEDFLQTPEYIEARDLYFASAEFAAAVDTRFEKEKESRYFDSLYETVKDKLTEDVGLLEEQLTKAIKTESNAVIDKYKALYPDTASAVVPDKKPGKETSEEPAEQSGEPAGDEPSGEVHDSDTPLDGFKRNFCANFNEFKREVRDQYYELNGKPKS